MLPTLDRGRDLPIFKPPCSLRVSEVRFRLEVWGWWRCFCELFVATVKPRYNVPLYNVFPRYNVDIFWPFTIDSHVKLPRYNVSFEVTLQNFGPQRNIISRFHCISILEASSNCKPQPQHRQNSHFQPLFRNPDVEPLVFTFLWNRCHQWLADIELIQISPFFVFSFQDEPVFHCWKAKRGWDLTINLRTPKINYCRIYSLWVQVHVYCWEFTRRDRDLAQACCAGALDHARYRKTGLLCTPRNFEPSSKFLGKKYLLVLRLPLRHS